MSQPGVPYTPYLPPIAPYVMPSRAYSQLLSAYGISLTWAKSHLCPCTFNGPNMLTGSPDPVCTTCSGYGYYWDAPSAPFNGLISFMHMAPSPDEPGVQMDEKFGQIMRSEPILTIPYSQSVAWSGCSLNDIIVEVNAIDRFNAQLQVGGRTSVVPYQQNLTIALTGAVTVYNPTTSGVQVVSGYTVSGAQVLLPSSYASGTAYIVEFYAAKTFVCWRAAGSLPHSRPFSGEPEPRRFRLQQLDLWLRGTGKI